MRMRLFLLFAVSVMVTVVTVARWPDRQLASDFILYLGSVDGVGGVSSAKTGTAKRAGFLRVRRLEIDAKGRLDLEHRVVVWMDGARCGLAVFTEVIVGARRVHTLVTCTADSGVAT